MPGPTVFSSVRPLDDLHPGIRRIAAAEVALVGIVPVVPSRFGTVWLKMPKQDTTFPASGENPHRTEPS